jgi:hypothetical protein
MKTSATDLPRNRPFSFLRDAGLLWAPAYQLQLPHFHAVLLIRGGGRLIFQVIAQEMMEIADNRIRPGAMCV